MIFNFSDAAELNFTSESLGDRHIDDSIETPAFQKIGRQIVCFLKQNSLKYNWYHCANAVARGHSKRRSEKADGFREMELRLIVQ